MRAPSGEETRHVGVECGAGGREPCGEEEDRICSRMQEEHALHPAVSDWSRAKRERNAGSCRQHHPALP